MPITLRGSGQVPVQIQTVTKTDPFTTTSTSYVAVTGLTVNITPASASNKVLVTGSVSYSGGSGQSMSVQLLRNGSPIFVGNTQGTRPQAFGSESGGGFQAPSNGFSFLDTPATTSAVTYSISVRVNGGTGAVNQCSGNRDGLDAVTASTITLMEISGT
jgi:hypothetical protein